jgi:ketosteroid isomerase-like protein
MKKIVLLLALCAVGYVAPAQSKDEQAVAAAVESLRKALVDPTPAALERLAAPELSYGHSSGLVEDRAAFIKALTSGESDFKTMDLTRQTIQVVGDVALVRHHLDADTNNGGVAGSTKLAILQVWQKRKGQWLLLARQAVKRP